MSVKTIGNGAFNVSGGTIRIGKPSNDSYYSYGTFSGYSSSVLLTNGRIALVPDNASKVVVLDQYTNTLTDGPTLTGYSSGVKRSDGTVVLSPYGATNIQVLAASGLTTTSVTATGGYIGAAMSGTTTVFVPGSSDNVRLLSSDNVTSIVTPTFETNLNDTVLATITGLSPSSWYRGDLINTAEGGGNLTSTVAGFTTGIDELPFLLSTSTANLLTATSAIATGGTFPTRVSIAMRVYIPAAAVLATGSHHLAVFAASNTICFRVAFTNGVFNLVSGGSGAVQVCYDYTGYYDKWTHIVAVYDNNNSTSITKFSLYLNGVKMTSTSIIIPTGTTSSGGAANGILYIGKWPGASWLAIANMKYSEVLLFAGVALDQTQVTTIYNAVTDQITYFNSTNNSLKSLLPTSWYRGTLTNVATGANLGGGVFVNSEFTVTGATLTQLPCLVASTTSAILTSTSVIGSAFPTKCSISMGLYIPYASISTDAFTEIATVATNDAVANSVNFRIRMNNLGQLNLLTGIESTSPTIYDFNKFFDEWVHVTCEYDSEKVSTYTQFALYINGVLQTPVSLTTLNTAIAVGTAGVKLYVGKWAGATKTETTLVRNTPSFTNNSTPVTGTTIWPTTNWALSAISNSAFAYQGTSGTEWNHNVTTYNGNVNPAVWWQIKFPVATTINNLNITGSAIEQSNPVNFNLQSSIDGIVAFTTVQSFTSPSGNGTNWWPAGQVRNFVVTNSHSPAQYWRISITGIGYTDGASRAGPRLRSVNFNTTSENTIAYNTAASARYSEIALFTGDLPAVGVPYQAYRDALNFKHKYFGGVSLPDNKVLFVPNSATKIAVIDPQPLSSATWNGSITDVSGYTGHLTYLSGTAASTVTGTFDGKPYINFGTAIYNATVSQFSNISQASISFWVNPTTATIDGTNTKILYWNGSSTSNARIEIISNKLYIYSGGFGGFSVPFTSALFPQNTWVHVTIVSSTTGIGSCKVYYNGVSQTPLTLELSLSGLIFPTVVNFQSTSSLLPYVDYRLTDLLDYSGRNKTLVATGTSGISLINGPKTGDGYLQVPSGSTVSTNIAPTTEYLTIANAAGTGSGLTISFDMKFNGSLPTSSDPSVYVFTLGTPRNGGVGDNGESVGINFQIFNGVSPPVFILLLTSINAATDTLYCRYANYALPINTWTHYDIRIPKTLTNSAVTMSLYANGTLLVPSLTERTPPSLVLSYSGGTNNNLLKFYNRSTTQVSNFKLWLSDNSSLLTTTTSSYLFSDIRFFNRLLTQEEVTKIKNNLPFFTINNTLTLTKPDVPDKYRGAVTLSNGKVVFVPSNASRVGIYDPVGSTFTEGAVVDKIVDVATGVHSSTANSPNFSFFLSTTGKVYVSGHNLFGKTGLNTLIGNIITPTKINIPLPVKQVSAYQSFALFLTNTGKVYVCGTNLTGRTGLNIATGNTLIPTQITETIGNLTISQVSAGATYSLFLTNTGIVYGCGQNVDGRVGTGDTTAYTIPTIVSTTNIGSLKISKIYAGADHSLFLTENGKVFVCGSNANGRTGRNTISGNILIPEQITDVIGSLTITQISAGYAHSLFLTNDGKVYACGLNDNGVTGLNLSSGDTLVPTQITSLNSLVITQISAGYQHALFLTNTGDVYVCGNNANGRTGLNTTTGNQLTPVKITALTVPIAQISAGNLHSLFVSTAGVVYSCGSNANGETAQNTLTGNTIVPTIIYPIPAGYSGGSLLPDGRVLFNPERADKAAVYDHVSDTIEFGTQTMTGYTGSVVLANRRAVMAPNSATTGIVYYPKQLKSTVDEMAFGPEATVYGGALLLPSGKVLFAPYSGSYPIITYDPTTKSITNTVANTTIYANGMALISGGRAIFMPEIVNGTIGIYNYYTNTIASGPAVGAGFKYRDCIKLSNGSVLLVPYSGTNVPIKIYTTTGTLETKTVTNGGYRGAVEFGSGTKVLLVPRETGATVGIYTIGTSNALVSPVNGTTSITGFVGGVLLTDGRILLVPQTATRIALYDPDTDTLREGASATGYTYGSLLPDGNVIMFPYTATKIAIYNPTNDTILFDLSATGYLGGVVLTNGDVVMAPHTATNIGIYTPIKGLNNPGDMTTKGALSVKNITTSGTANTKFTITSQQYFLKWLQGITNVRKNVWWCSASKLQFSTITPSVAITGVENGWGAILMKDGRVMFPPRNGDNVLVFNPKNNLCTSYSTGLGTAEKYMGGVLLQDGRVVCVPFGTATIKIFNPSDNSFTQISATTYSGYVGGVLLPNGKVLFAPHTATTIAIFDPIANTVTATISATGYLGGILLPDGRVVLVPNSSSTIGIYDPVTNTFSSTVGATGYVCGVLLPDGRVLCVPYTATKIGIFDPSGTGSFSTPNSTTITGCAGAVLLPDGKVLMTMYNSSQTLKIYDPVANVDTDVNSISYTGYNGGVLIPDGRVILAPSTARNIGVLSGFPTVPIERCLHPCFNKL